MPPKGKEGPGSAKLSSRRQRTQAPSWRLPPVPWILSAGAPSETLPPSRVLVCGAVAEALLLAKSLPQADIVVLDPSEKLARSLRLSAKRRHLGNLTSLSAPPDQPHLAEITGRNFDLVLAIAPPPDPSATAAFLANLSACLSRPHGRLYFKTCGDAHPFVQTTDTLNCLGLSPRLADSISRDAPPLLHLAAALAGDEFAGSVPFPSSTLSLADWVSAFRSHGLHFAAALHVPSVLSRALNFGGVQPLLSFSTESLAALLDSLAHPINRHLLFSVSPCPEPPFHDLVSLLAWRPSVRFWPRERIPPQQTPFTRSLSVELQIQRVLPPLQMQMSGYLLELLRLSGGKLSLAEIMALIPHPTSVEEILPALWFFHHACILHLQPPPTQ